MINKIKMLYDIYFSRINVDRQLQLEKTLTCGKEYFSRINVDRQLQRESTPARRAAHFSRINVDRQLQPASDGFRRGSTLAGSMWTGNYNGRGGTPGV